MQVARLLGVCQTPRLRAVLIAGIDCSAASSRASDRRSPPARCKLPTLCRRFERTVEGRYGPLGYLLKRAGRISVYQVDPADVLTAGSNFSPRAISTARRRPLFSFNFTPPGGYQFQSNVVNVPLASREGFFVVEARRGERRRAGVDQSLARRLDCKETPGGVLLYGADLGTGMPLARMRVQLVVNRSFVTTATDSQGIVRWNRLPRPVFALAQWGGSYAFLSLLPQAPLPPTIVGVATDSAVVHAGGVVRVAGFARTRSSGILRASSGSALVSLRYGATTVVRASAWRSMERARSRRRLTFRKRCRPGEYAGARAGRRRHRRGDRRRRRERRGDCRSRSLRPATDAAIRARTCRCSCTLHGRKARCASSSFARRMSTWVKRRRTCLGQRRVGSTRPCVPIKAATRRSKFRTQMTNSARRTAFTQSRMAQPRTRAWSFRPPMPPCGSSSSHRSRALVRRCASTSMPPPLIRKPLDGATVTVDLTHGVSVARQELKLDAVGHAAGSFSDPQLGTNFLVAWIDDGGRATDAAQVRIDPRRRSRQTTAAARTCKIALDRTTYRMGESIGVDADAPGSQGEALITFEGALGVEARLVRVVDGRAAAEFRAVDAAGELRAGAAFVHDGATRVEHAAD